MTGALQGVAKISPVWAGRLGTGLRSIDDWQHTVRTRRRIAALAALGPERPISRLMEDYRRSSDTVFILGSGGSVAAIGEEGWSHIRKHDSIGFNFWLIHPHRPSLYFIEGLRYLESYRTMIDWIHKRELAYRDIPLVIEYKLWSHWGCRLEDLPDSIRAHTYLNAPWFKPTYDQDRMRQYLRRWRALGSSPVDQLVNMIHHRATVGALVATAYCLGYRRIVLVGVDLNSTRYFFEEMEGLEGPFPQNIETAGVHQTMLEVAEQPTYGLPIDVYLQLIKEEVLEPAGVGLYNASPISRLVSLLPYYALEETAIGPVDGIEGDLGDGSGSEGEGSARRDP